MKTKALHWTAALLTSFAFIGQPNMASAQEETPTEQGDMETFWTDQEQIIAVQNRHFEKQGRLALSLFGSIVPNHAFTHAYSVGLHSSFYLSETFGLEFSGSYVAISTNTDLNDFIARESQPTDRLNEQVWNANIVALWSPFYGKFSFIGRKIAHFDWAFALGAGVINLVSESEANTDIEESVIAPELTLGTGWTFWITQNFVARMDYRLHVYQKPENDIIFSDPNSIEAVDEGFSLITPSELSLGLGYYF